MEGTDAYKLPSSHEEDVGDADSRDSAPGPSEAEVPPSESGPTRGSSVDVFETCFPARERTQRPRESVISPSNMKSFGEGWG